MLTQDLPFKKRFTNRQAVSEGGCYISPETGENILRNIKKGNVEKVEKLLRHFQLATTFADPLFNGATPLHFAVESLNPAMVGLIASLKPVSINNCDFAGLTPLHYLAASNLKNVSPDTIYAIFNTLVEHDVSLTNTSNHQLTAQQIARNHGNTYLEALIAERLQTHNARLVI